MNRRIRRIIAEEMYTKISFHIKTGRHRRYGAASSPIIRLWKAHVQIREADHTTDLGKRVCAFSWADLQK